MKRSDFKARLETIKVGDYVSLLVRGNYGNYRHEGKLVKIEDNRVYLSEGMSHSYKRILSIGLTSEVPEKCKFFKTCSIAVNKDHFEHVCSTRSWVHCEVVCPEDIWEYKTPQVCPEDIWEYKTPQEWAKEAKKNE